MENKMANEKDIKHLTDKELSEKREQLEQIGMEIANKKDPTDEDSDKIADCRKQIDSIDAEIERRNNFNENKQYFNKNKEEKKNIEQRAGRDDLLNPPISQEQESATQESFASVRYVPSRCPALMRRPGIMIGRRGIISRAEGVGNPTPSKEVTDAIKLMAAQLTYLKNGSPECLQNIQSRADTFGVLTDNRAIIPTLVSDEIIAEVMEVANILQRCYVIQYPGEYKILKKDLSTDKIRTKKTDEREKIESHVYKYSDLVLKDSTIRSKVELTNTLINAAPFDVVLDVMNDMRDTFSYDFEDSLFHPDVHNMADAETFGFAGVTNEITSQKGNVITLHDLLNLIEAVPARYSANAVFLMNRATRFRLKHIEDAIGHLQYMPDPNTGRKDMYFDGYPIIDVDSISGIEAGKHAVYFGDLDGMAVKIGRRVTINRQPLYETDSEGLYGVMAFDARVRAPFKLAKLKMKAD